MFCSLDVQFSSVCVFQCYHSRSFAVVPSPLRPPSTASSTCPCPLPSRPTSSPTFSPTRHACASKVSPTAPATSTTRSTRLCGPATPPRTVGKAAASANPGLFFHLLCHYLCFVGGRGEGGGGGGLGRGDISLLHLSDKSCQARGDVICARLDSFKMTQQNFIGTERCKVFSKSCLFLMWFERLAAKVSAMRWCIIWCQTLTLECVAVAGSGSTQRRMPFKRAGTPKAKFSLVSLCLCFNLWQYLLHLVFCKHSSITA